MKYIIAGSIDGEEHATLWQQIDSYGYTSIAYKLRGQWRHHGAGSIITKEFHGNSRKITEEEAAMILFSIKD